MAIIEQMELVRHRGDIIADVQGVVDKYREIFGTDVPGLDKNAADKLILMEIRIALRIIENELPG